MQRESETVIIATQNIGKVKEFQTAFTSLGKRVVSLLDYPHLPAVVEDGITFKANALKKARQMATELNLPVLADDSGLCVERLAGAPGVYSARYAGEYSNYDANNEKLVTELKKLPAYEVQDPLLKTAGVKVLSPAQFVCCLVLYHPISGQYIDVVGTTDGYIIDEQCGEQGFGYDPLFYVPTYGCTMAQLTEEQKQCISHRGKALKQLRQHLA